MNDIRRLGAAAACSAFEPAEGGVKIVFDVPDRDRPEVAQLVAGAGFDVRRYYDVGDDQRRRDLLRGHLIHVCQQMVDGMTN